MKSPFLKKMKPFLLSASFLGFQMVAQNAIAAPLAAPTSLSAKAASATEVELQWKDNSGIELGFIIQRALHGKTTFSKIGTTSANGVTFKDTSVSAKTAYDYRVEAYSKNKRGHTVYSSFSNIASVTTPDVSSPPAPAAGCTFNGQTIASGSTVKAYQTASVPYGSSCTAETRTCTNGTLSGSYQYASCTIAPAPTPTPTPTPAPTPTPTPTGAITDVKIQSLSSANQSNVPVTFGQVFAPGHLLASESLAGKMADGSVIPLQVDVKATHPDGSVRHAVISAVIPQVNAGQTLTMGLGKIAQTTQAASGPSNLLAAGYTTKVTLNLAGVIYTASADQLLKAGALKQWLGGSIANEWLVSAPFKNSQGVSHPHLTARFAVRSYTGLNRAKVDVIVENDWAYEPSPQNQLYDVQIEVGGQNVYSKTGLNHYHHARWKKSFWWGAAPSVHLRQNATYMMASRAVPNYDPTIVIPEASLEKMKTDWTGPGTEPMGTGFTQPAMPTVGGRPDIGLMPAWDVMYLISQDPRAKTASLGTSDLAGSFSMHYRDKNTDLPMSVVNWPYSTLLGNPGDTVNPATNKSEAFPACGGDCSTPSVTNPAVTIQWDAAHQPNFAYLAYLVTGDHYYLEEMHFWTMFNMFKNNPYYRDFDKGLFKADEGRGQAWAMRSLADSAYITPDNHPLKAQLVTFLNNNISWYDANYTNDPNANKLGVIINGYVIGYNNNRGLAPWQDDFFTQAIGHAVELGFTKAQPLLNWKAKFSISRMTDPGFCWIVGAAYFMNVRDSETSPFYTTMSQVYQGTFPADFTSLPCGGSEMAAHESLKVGEMTGYSYSTEGYPSNMQPALAYSVTSGAANGVKAWQVFIGRSVKPDYGTSPQFAIVPRQ